MDKLLMLAIALDIITIVAVLSSAADNERDNVVTRRQIAEVLRDLAAVRDDMKPTTWGQE